MASRLRGCLVWATLLAILWSSPCTARAEEPETALAKAVQLAQEGEYEAAEATLRAAIEQLTAKKEARKKLVRAYVYLAVACVGANREAAGRKAFLEALKLEPEVETSAREFPPRFIQFFDGVRQEAWASGAVKRPPKKEEKKNAPSVVAAKDVKSSRGKGKWLLAGGGVVAAGGAAVLLATGKANTAPSAGTITISPSGAGIVDATSFAFSVSGAADADGDSLTYSWDFGDGHAGSGTSVSHVYAAADRFTVVLKVSDGTLSATTQASVLVRSLNGVWVNTYQDVERMWTIAQQGQVLTGTYHHSLLSPAVGSGFISGTVSSPRGVRVEATLPGVGTFDFVGSADESIDTLTGLANRAGFSDTTLTFTRQQ